ncbi:MAG: hypothetical protein NDF51_05845 [archaeon YNP-WB-040]|nr:hypothetical protein [Candidatus Culexarchaeum yellowstonense]
MRFLAREPAVEILGEENCIRVLSDLYVCGLDYLLVKRIVFASIVDDAYGFVGDVPILPTCGKYLLYYGVPKALFSDRFVVPGWRTAESRDSVVVYDCFDDVMEFFEVEVFTFMKVPLSMFGFGLAELYGYLIDLLRKKSLYMLRFVY